MNPRESFNLESKDPLKQFESWFTEAQKHPNIKEPTAVCLATCSKNGCPSCRMMSIAQFDPRGFVFFTNLKSNKAQELESNPRASICYYWEPLDRQVTISGSVKQLSRDEAKEHFDRLPFESKLNYYISKQGKPIDNKQSLVEIRENIRKQFEKDKNVPLPEQWGGFILVPEVYDFWQRGPHDFDDNVRFRLSSKTNGQTSGEQQNWIYEEIAP